MTHTAGFCLRHVERRRGQISGEDRHPDIISCLNAALKAPIMTDPGTRWEYGTNIDFVGKAVEAVSGKKLDAYLRDNMFAPLGMNDTGFKITRLACASGWSACMRARGRALAPIPFELEQAPEFHMGGGGLYGTAADYIKFTQMILNKGSGRRQPAAEARDGGADGPEPYRRSHASARCRRRRRSTPTMSISIPTSSKKWGLIVPDQHRQDAGRPQRRQPRLGRPRQHLFLDRSGAQCRRRDPDAAVAVRRRQVRWKRLRGSSAGFMPGSMPGGKAA